MALWLTAQELIKENKELKQNIKNIQEALRKTLEYIMAKTIFSDLAQRARFLRF